MNDIQDDLAAIKAALEAGPTFAEWEVLDDSRHIYSKTLVDDGEDSWLPLIAVTDDDETLIDFEANARYIAACNPVAIRTLLDRLKAAEAEVERLRCNAMQWRKPGPVTAEHPLDCLIVVPALRQADGDWWIEGSKFLADDAPIAWCADTSITRAALENTDAR